MSTDSKNSPSKHRDGYLDAQRNIEIPLVFVDDDKENRDFISSLVEQKKLPYRFYGARNRKTLEEAMLEINSPFVMICDHELSTKSTNPIYGWQLSLDVLKDHPFSLFSEFIYYSGKNQLKNEVFQISENMIKAGCHAGFHYLQKSGGSIVDETLSSLLPKLHQNIMDRCEKFSKNGVLFPMWYAKKLKEAKRQLLRKGIKRDGKS